MTEFEELAHKRWERGVASIRGGDGSKPFKGDPIAEGIEECLDGHNYALEAERQGRLTLDESYELRRLFFAAYLILRDVS